MVVFCRQAERAGFDAHVDVFGNQHHFSLRVLDAQGFDHSQNLVVGFALWQAGRQGEVKRLGLEEQASAHFNVASAVQLDASDDVRVV